MLGAHRLQIRKAGDDIVRQKREHRQAVIRRAHVVASTLVSAGGELKQLLPHNLLFDAIVIDEVLIWTTNIAAPLDAADIVICWQCKSGWQVSH